MTSEKKLSLKQKIHIGFRKSIVIIMFFVLWEVLPRIGVVDRMFIPAFSDVVLTIINLTTAKVGLLEHTRVSLTRALEGFALAFVISIPLGFILGGWFKTVKEYFDPLLQILAQVNPFSVFPIFILFFGIGEISKVAIIFWVCLWPMLFNTISGVNNIDPLIIKAARAMGTSKSSLFLKVVLPGSAPFIFAGAKLGLGSAFLMLIAAEMVGASAGLGWLVLNSQHNFNIQRLFAAAFVIAILGIAVTKLVSFIEKKLITWIDTTNIA